MERSKKVVLGGLLIMELLAAVDVTGVTVMVPTLQGYFHIPEQVSGWILMAYLLPFSLLLVPMGWLADKSGKLENIVLWSIFTFGLASLGCAIAPTSHWLIICRVIKGIAAAGMFATEFAIIIKYWEKPRRTIEIVVTGLAIGVLIGPVVGGVFASNNLWRYFFLTGSILALSGFVAYFSLKNLQPAQREADQAITETLSGKKKAQLLFKALAWGMLLDVVISTATQGTNLLITLHVQEHLGKSPLFNSSILMIISLGMIIANVAGIGSRLFKKVETAVWVSGATLAGLLVLLAVTTNWINPLAFTLYLLMGIMLGIILSTIELMVLHPLPTTMLAQGNGWIVSSMQAGYGLGAFVVPLLYIKTGISLTAIILAGLVLTTIGAFLAFKKK